MAQLNYYIIDVFTSERYAGNPAAVVLEADDLTKDQMQAIAREFNLSETTFVMNSPSPDAAVAIRWFTPTTEVDMCGHGTIGAVHALIESGRFISLPDDKGTILPIQTKKALLSTRCEQMKQAGEEVFLVWLDLAKPQLKKKHCVPSLWSEYLDVPQDSFDLNLPSMQTQDGDVLVFFKSLPPILAAQPEFPKLAKFCKQQHIRGFCLSTTATLAPSITVQSRFFAPAVGINEDPVTGSVHGPLAAYLVSAGVVPTIKNVATLSCVQTDSTARAGLLRVVAIRDEEAIFRVRIAGQCTTVMEGKLYV